MSGRVLGPPDTSVSNGNFAVAGDAKTYPTVLRCQTIGTVPGELYLDGVATRLVLADRTSYNIQGRVIARRTDSRTPQQDAVYGVDGHATRDLGASTVVWIPYDSFTAGGTLLWSLGVVADTTLGAIRLEPVGDVGATILWVAFLQITLVHG